MPSASEMKESAKNSAQFLKETAKGERRPAQGTRFIYAPLLLVTIAFGLSVLALASCQFVIYEDWISNAEVTRDSTGIYCYDTSLKEKVQNFFIGSVQVFVQVIGTGTAVLGGIATFLLWRAIKKPHGQCIFRTLACCVICCVPGQFMTLSMLQSDYCWNYSELSNNCTLGWGGNVSIASGCLYCIAVCALWLVPDADDLLMEREQEEKEKEEEERKAAAQSQSKEAPADGDEEAPVTNEQ